MADNLESYFKKHLSDDTPGDDQWNVPDEEVWNKALPGIRERRGIFIPWRYFFLAGALLLAGLGILLWFLLSPDIETSAPSVSGLPAEKSEMTGKAGKGTEEPAFGYDAVNDRHESATEERAGNRDNKMANTVQPDPGSNAAPAAGRTAEAEGIISETSEMPQPSSATPSVPYEGMTGHARVDNMMMILPAFGAGPIPQSRKAPAATLPERVYEVPDLTPEKLRINYHNKGRFAAGAFYAPTFNNTTVLVDSDPGMLETGNVYLYSGNFGAEFRYYLSDRLSIHTGIERSEIKSWSRSEVDFAYDASTERIEYFSVKENTSPVPMATPFGEIQTAITYRFPAEAEIPDGETMNSVLETHQEVLYFSIPLGLEYNIIPFSSFNWHAEGGVRYNRAYRDATRFTSRILHFGEDMQVVREEMESHPSYTMNFLNFYVGSGINYRFSDAFLVNGSARYFRSITRVNVLEDGSTSVQGFGMKIGFLYFF